MTTYTGPQLYHWREWRDAALAAADARMDHAMFRRADGAVTIPITHKSTLAVSVVVVNAERVKSN